MAAKLPLEKSHATAIVTRGEWTAVTYHDTEVIGFDDKTIRLDSGGYLASVSTFRRINQGGDKFNLGLQVNRISGHWFVRFFDRPDDDPIPFYDGLILSRDRSAPLPGERETPPERDYNGWPNRSTWNVMLWLNNHEPYYRAYVAAVRVQEMTPAAAQAFCIRLFGYKSMFKARTPDGDAFVCVHWPRIAAAMNEARQP